MIVTHLIGGLGNQMFQPAARVRMANASGSNLHVIMTNSSYSWWAAWLNSRKDKIVLGRRRGFAADRRAL